jgi:hypothetical protein
VRTTKEKIPMEDQKVAILRPGTRLRSQTCTTEIIVIRPGRGTVRLTCGGKPMIDIASRGAGSHPAAAGLDTGSALGKRYTAASDDTFEVLVTQAGAGTLADGMTPLIFKEAKPLPSSD